MKSKNFKFDKFMKDITKREDESRQKAIDHQAGQDDLPARRYNRLYREHWQNRTHFRIKNDND